MASTPNRTMISGLAVVCVLLVCGGTQYPSGPASAAKRWTVSSFLEFSRGTLGDAGANTYVTAAGEVKLINLWDLNRDGFIDIVLPNTHDNNEQIDLFIYWGVDENHVGRRTRLPSGGGTGQALGDLNRDGFTDLVVVNGRNGIKSNLDSFIYWGGAQGFDAGRRTELPTLGGMAAAVADLNGDGYPEIVFANSAAAGGRPSEPENASFLYWGSKEGFSIERRQSLPTAAATDVAVADLDRDGSPEIVFANEGSGANLGGAMVYWGGSGGSYSADRRTVLPGQRSSAVALADLNGDRVPEIVLANRYRPRMREPEDRSEWDTDVDSESIPSFVYWGSSQGYSADRRLALPTVAASSVAAADLNKDGLPDLVFANGPQKSGHAAPGPGSGSPIYWNGAEGFKPHRRTVLPTLNPTDSLIEDLNRDGYPDLVFSNEHNARTYQAPSYVYWGGPAGFDTARRLELTTLGAAGAGSADFDKDGKKDLVFVNRIDGSAGDPVPAYVYWGNERGELQRGPAPGSLPPLRFSGGGILLRRSRQRRLGGHLHGRSGIGSLLGFAPGLQLDPTRPWSPPRWPFRPGRPTSIETATWTWSSASMPPGMGPTSTGAVPWGLPATIASPFRSRASAARALPTSTATAGWTWCSPR